MHIRFWLRREEDREQLFSAFRVRSAGHLNLHQSDLYTPRKDADLLYWRIHAVLPVLQETNPRPLEISTILERVPDWEIRLENRFVSLSEKLAEGFESQPVLFVLDGLKQLQVVNPGWQGRFDPHQHLLANRSLRMVGPGHPDFHTKITLKEWNECYRENWEQDQKQGYPVPWD